MGILPRWNRRTGLPQPHRNQPLLLLQKILPPRTQHNNNRNRTSPFAHCQALPQDLKEKVHFSTASRKLERRRFRKIPKGSRSDDSKSTSRSQAHHRFLNHHFFLPLLILYIFLFF